MKALVWKELHEHVKWSALTLVVVSGLMYLRLKRPELESIMNPVFLLVTSLVGAAFATTLGFLQFFFESQGDRRAFLLHRPISPTRIFLAKTLTGVGLYLVAMSLPFTAAVVWAATPGNIAAPFRWPMSLPGLADILAGIPYYFAGVLVAQREARWYGSRALSLVAAILCSICVWLLPEFQHALVAILVIGGLIGVAAWGGFIGGGSYPASPFAARIALAAIFLVGLLVIGIGSQLLLETSLQAPSRAWHILDHQGRILVVHNDTGEISVTDLDGRPLPDLKGQALDSHVVRQMHVPTVPLASGTKLRWYRFVDGMFLPIPKDSSPGERWFYVFDRACLLGYDMSTRQLIGSIGPHGFVPVDQGFSEPFQGELHARRGYFIAGIHSLDFLSFSDQAYKIDYGRRLINPIFTPDAGDSIEAAEARDDRTRSFLAFLLTDRALYGVDEKGHRLSFAPLAFDKREFQLEAAQLDDPSRFVVWYRPCEMTEDLLGVGQFTTEVLRQVVLKHLPSIWESRTVDSHLVEVNAAGQELNRQAVPPVPSTNPAPARTIYGLITPPAVYLLRSGSDWMWSNRENAEVQISAWLLPFVALMMLSATASAIISGGLARRYAFSRARCVEWTLCSLLMGPFGLLLMLSLQEWPARIPCPVCHRLCVATSKACAQCGADQPSATTDGTEILERLPSIPYCA